MRGSVNLWMILFLFAAAGAAGWLVLGESADDSSEALFGAAEHEVKEPALGPMLSGTTRAKTENGALDEGRFEIPGRVLDSKGKPVAGVAVTARRRGDAYDVHDPRRWQGNSFAALERAFVELSSAEAPPVASRASSAADGTFTLLVTRRGEYDLRAEPAPPRVGTTTSWYLNATPPRVPVELHVLDGSALRGRVVDEQGQGVAAVLRAGWSSEARGWSALPLTTDPATGAFAYPAVPAGKVRIEVSIPGKLRFTSRAIVTPTDAEVVIRVSGGTPLLTGLVRGADGRPIAGARVAASIQRAYEAGVPASGEAVSVRYFAQSDSEGAFELGGPFVGALSGLEAAAAGYVPSSTAPPLASWSGLELAEGRAGRVEIVLYQGGILEGRVLEISTGQPLAGADVQVLPMAVDARMTRPPQSRALSDAQGRYRVEGIAVGRSVLLVRHASHHLPALEAMASRSGNGQVFWSEDMATPVAPPSMTIFIEREGQRLTRDLELSPGVGVRGLVVDSQGQPVAGAEVRARGMGLGQAAWQWGLHTDPGAPLLATSGPDGRFEIAGLPARKDWVLFAKKAPLVGENSAPTAVSAEAPPKDLVLKLVSGCVVAGRVLDGLGLPVSGATVYVSSQSQDMQGEHVQGRSKEDGTFRLEGLPWGQAALSVSSQGLGNSHQQLDPLTAGEVREDIEIKLGAGTATLTGVLVDEKGNPVAYKQLMAINQAGGTNSQTQSDSEGAFRFEGLGVGSTQIFGGDWSNRAELTTVTTPTQDVRVTWKEPPSGVLEGLVLDPQGKPVPICQVKVKGAGGNSGEMMHWGGQQGELAVNGWFRRQAQGAAPYSVVVSRPQDGEGRALNLKGKTVPVPDLKACPITITLEAGVEIAGRVLDGSGRGVAGIAVAVGTVSTLTDAEGGFALGGLAEGPVIVQASPPAPFVRPQPVSTTTGTRDVVIRLTSGLAIAGEVRGPDGRPKGNGWVQASWKAPGSGNGNQSANVGQDGRFRIEGVPPEAVATLSVQLWNQGGGGQAPPKTVENVRAGTEDLVIEVGVGAKVSGSVTDANGKPFSQGWVQVATRKEGQQGDASGSVMHHVEIKEDGSFTLEGLDPGKPLVLSVYLRDGGATAESVTVHPPATNVRLTVPAMTPIKGRIQGSLGSGKWRVWAWLVSDTNKQARSRNIDSEGRFTLDGVSGAGPWMIGARSSDDERYALAGPVEGGAENVMLTLRQGRSIEGRLLTSDGTSPGENSNVSASQNGWSTSARTDAQGNFKLRGLPPGRYTLQAWSNEGHQATQADVEDGATGVRLTLAPR